MNHSQKQHDLRATEVVNVPARIQGGNWKMHGFRRSGLVYDESECQMSIAEFMADQEIPRDIGDA